GRSERRPALESTPEVVADEAREATDEWRRLEIADRTGGHQTERQAGLGEGVESVRRPTDDRDRVGADVAPPCPSPGTRRLQNDQGAQVAKNLGHIGYVAGHARQSHGTDLRQPVAKDIVD